MTIKDVKGNDVEWLGPAKPRMCPRHGLMDCYISHYLDVAYSDKYGGFHATKPQRYRNCSWYACSYCGGREGGDPLPDDLFIPDCLKR